MGCSELVGVDCVEVSFRSSDLVLSLLLVKSGFWNFVLTIAEDADSASSVVDEADEGVGDRLLK